MNPKHPETDLTRQKQLRKGFHLTSAVLVILSVIALIYASFLGNIDSSITLPFYLILLFASAIVITGSFSFLIPIVIAIVAILDNHTGPSLGFQMDLLYGAAALLSGLLSLKRYAMEWQIETYRQKLADEVSTLEHRIEDRTRDLKEAQLEKMNSLHRFAEIGRLASGLFHDLTNPLSALKLNMEQLREIPQQTTDKDLERCITGAFEASQRMEQFLKTVLNQLKSQDDRSLFSVPAETRQAIELLGYKTRATGTTLHLDSPEEVLLYGSTVKFSQAIVNLISNAIDAVDDSSISLDNRHVRIAVKISDSELFISVSDSGKGVAEDMLPYIFDPFTTTKSSESGTGLGLAITKEMIENHFMGTIQVENGSKGGCVFTLKLPLSHKTDNRSLEKTF